MKRIRAFLRRHADDHTIQRQLDLDELESHARFMITITRSIDPKLSGSVPEKLVDRLVDAILYRRAKLVYKDHKKAVESRDLPYRYFFHDIEPYVCLFPDCATASFLFREPEQWLDHMQLHVAAHVTVWCCDLCPSSDGQPESFNTLLEMERHLQYDHPELEEDQVTLLAESFYQLREKSAYAQLFSQLNAHSLLKENFLKHEQKIVRTATCVFCRSEFEEEKKGFEDLYSNLSQHLIQHLESFALLSLKKVGDSIPQSDDSLARVCLTQKYTRSSSSSSLNPRVKDSSELLGFRVGSMEDHHDAGDPALKSGESVAGSRAILNQLPAPGAPEGPKLFAESISNSDTAAERPQDQLRKTRSGKGKWRVKGGWKMQEDNYW